MKNPNFDKKSTIFKALIVIFAIILVIGGIYSFFGTDSAKMKKPKNGRIATVADVEEVIANWIEENPEAILTSVANMQKKALQERNKQAQQSISSKKSEIFDDRAPAFKPSGYDVTIVEFYDYNCGYCKRANAAVEELLKKDKKVRVIYRDFPILGPSSEELAKVSVAVDVVDSKKFREFHNELMESKASTQEEALQVVKKVGINVDKVKKVLSEKQSRIMEILNDNRRLGSSVGIQGTPAFVIGEELIPGAIGADQLQEKINAVRGS